MKKFKLFAASLAALALAGCTSEDYLGDSVQRSNVIGFGTGLKAVTRADFVHGDAAEKLNNNFIVYGFKTNGTEAGDASTDQKVFDLYNVNYTAGTANTTESNTADWEYVGYANHNNSVASQTIKYWDLSAGSYVFSAVSGTGITAEKIETGTTSVYDKGWKVTVPAGGSIADLYASDRKPVAPANFKEQVDLTFRALGTKIRFAIYETVPGYSVHIDKVFYHDDSDEKKNSETNFAIQGNFKTANANAETPLTITYYDDTDASIENRPKVTYADGDVTSSTFGVFGANIQATPAIGTTSPEATYDQSDKSYTMILPYENSSNVMKLKVNYTLKSTDGSNEEIKVYGATAVVPAQYNQWKPNYAYTYLFKISDNTNGSTVPPTDPDDPDYDPEDPNVGLYPITFDACVVTDDSDVQETITTVSEPSITTYSAGVIVTENNEYKPGNDVYVTVKEATALATLTGKAQVYEVHNFGTIENISEAVVDNYMSNFCVLTPVVCTVTNEVPRTDGTMMTFADNTVMKFTTEAGKVYAFEYNNGTKKFYKVIRVTGSETAPTFTLTQTDGSNPITTVAGVTMLTLTQGSTPVLGAVPCFTITSDNGNNALKVVETGNGVYTISVDGDAIKAGKANGKYTVSFEGKSSVEIEVNIANVLTPTSVTVVAGNTTGANTEFTIAGALSDDGVIVNNNKGITVKSVGSGKYNVTAASNVAAGAYTATVGGETLTINVDSYTFLESRTFTLDYEGNAPQQTLYLTKNNNSEYVDADVTDMTGINESVAKIIKSGTGIYAVVPMGPGSYTVKYENASAVITVNQYTIATPASIKKSTGIANIEVKCNGTAINAATASLVEIAKPAGAVYTVSTNGKTIKFSSASKAGDYKFDYKVDGKIVAQVTVTVTE